MQSLIKRFSANISVYEKTVLFSLSYLLGTIFNHYFLFVNYRKRPTIKQCLAHPWLATEEEPPSPSPLMLKIPTPDLSEPVHKSSHGHGSGSSGSLGVGHHGPSGSRRYVQFRSPVMMIL